jgi:CheY-like chemotaxis protein
MKNNTYHKNVILWADDDADDLFLVREAIANLDDSYELVEAANGQQALECLCSLKASSKLPCLVVLDINMPVLNGKETLAILKEKDWLKTMPVAVFTTSNSEKDRQFCEEFGVQMFSKPHTYAGFERMIGRLITFCKSGSGNSPSLS